MAYGTLGGNGEDGPGQEAEGDAGERPANLVVDEAAMAHELGRPQRRNDLEVHFPVLVEVLGGEPDRGQPADAMRVLARQLADRLRTF